METLILSDFLSIDFDPPMALRYVGGVLELSKLDFRGVKFQINVKKDNFRGLIAKIRYFRSILTSTTHIWIMPWELCTKVFRRDSRAKKIRFQGSQQPI